MTEHIDWNWLVVADLFLAGTSAGLIFFSGLANFLSTERYRNVARWGAYLAPFPVSLGLFLLLLDLGRPFRFFRLFFTVEFTSPMSIGSWLLGAFAMLCYVYAWHWLPDTFRFFRYGGEEKIRNLLAALGMPLAIGTGIYTGVLLGAVPARPFWNTPIVAELFLFSGLASGAALLILVLSLLRDKAEGDDQGQRERKLLTIAVLNLVVVEIFLIIPFILHSSLSTQSVAQSMELILGGSFSTAFWGGVVGLGLVGPLLLGTYELWPAVLSSKREIRFNPLLGLIFSTMVLAGGIILRYVFVYAGQHSHFG